MEDILGFIIVIIGLIGSAVSSAKKKQAKTTSFPPVTQPQRASTATAPASMASMLPKTEPTITPMQPTVHTHLEPDCETHDQSGSLGVKSPEGKDPCHEEQMAARRAPVEEAEPAPGIALDWTGENLVKAFVMQEVLTRPCQRRAAR